MNSLKKAVVLVFFCCASALFGMESKTVWSLESIEKNRAAIFWNKITDESESAALYLVNNFDYKLTKEKTTTLLRSFTTGQLQMLFRNIQYYAQNRTDSLELYLLASLLTPQKAYDIIGEILLAMDTNTIKNLDDEYIRQYAKVYFQQLLDLAPTDMQAAVECAALASEPELFKNNRLKKFQQIVGEQVVLNMFKCAIPGFLEIASATKLPSNATPFAVKRAISNNKNKIKEYTNKMSFLGRPGLIYWIIGEQESKNKTKRRTSIDPDQFVYNVPTEMLKKIFADIKKDDAVALAKILSNRCIPNYFDSIPPTLSSDIDLVIACAKGLIKAKKHSQAIMTVACACGAVLETDNTQRIGAVKELLEKLSIEEATILLGSTDKKNNPSLYETLFNNLSTCNQEVLNPQTKKVLLMKNSWWDRSLRRSKSSIDETPSIGASRIANTELKNALQMPEERDVLALLTKITRPIACSITINTQDKKPIKVKLAQQKQIKLESTPNPTDEIKKQAPVVQNTNSTTQEPVKNTTQKPNKTTTQKPLPAIKKPAASSSESVLPGLFSGLALTYAFFNWKNWGDIKNKNVFLPLAAGLFPALYAKNTQTQKALYYGPLMGSFTRLFVQSSQQGGFKNFVRKSYMGTQRSDRDMIIANIGAVTGFLAGLFDIGFINTIVNPLQTLFGKQQPVTQKISVEKSPINITKKIATTGCYIVKTGISMISPAYTRLVETTEYAGRTTRAILQKVGLP